MRTSQSTIVLSLIALPLLVLGCGSSNSNPDGAASNSEASVSMPDAAVTGEDGSAVAIDGSTIQTVGVDGAVASGFCTSKPVDSSVTDLSGVWVAKLTGAQVVNSGITKAIHNKNVYYQLLTIQQTGSTITVDGRYCDRTEVNDPNALVPVQIPDAWAHTETAIHRTGDFSPSGGSYAVLNLPVYFEAIGAHLTSASDTLPTTATDPRVYDEDNDGNPGITIRLSGLVSGAVYSAQSQTTSILAVAVSADRVEGSLSFTSNQTVLASNPSTIKSLYDSSTTTPDYATCSSTFVMVKLSASSSGAVDGGSNVTCAWIRANETTLFQ